MQKKCFKTKDLTGMSSVYFLILLVVYHTAPATCFITGATDSSCRTLHPNHGPSNATGPPPYSLSLSQSTYKPGDVLQVTLSGLNGNSFKGFLIIAKTINGPSDGIGYFTAIADTHTICSKPLGNGVTHSNNTVKSSLTFNWTAPSTSQGDLVFHYTVVRGNPAIGKTDYFENITSTSLTAAQAANFNKNAECGTTRGCFSNCQNNVCEWEITWKNVGAQIDFTIKSIVASTNTYYALGFSSTGYMSPASVVSCITHNVYTTVNASYNTGRSNSPLSDPQEGIYNQSNSYSNGLLQCSFLRDIVSSDSKASNLTDPWYLIAAKGPVHADGSLGYHGPDTFVTSTTINLTNSTEDYPWPSITTSAAPTISTSATAGFNKNTECGLTRGCFSNCQNNVCEWEITWKNAGAVINMTIKAVIASTDAYYALGFSGTGYMSPASVVSCITHNVYTTVNASYNTGRSNSPLSNPQEGIHNQANSYSNGLLQCSFSHDIVSSDSKSSNLTDPWYLIAAKGKVDTDGSLVYHGPDTFVTSTTINLTNSTADYPWPSITTSAAPTTSAPGKKFKKDPGCGKTKACYSNCRDNSCDLLLSWKTVGDNFEISLKSVFPQEDNYIAIGLSEGPKMSPASVIGCSVYKSSVKVTASHNDGFKNIPLDNPNEGLSNINGSYVDGILSCTAFRETTSDNRNIFNLTNHWYLITARGKALPDGLISQHDPTQAFFTKSKINFHDVTVDISLDEPDFSLVKVHGSLMVIAWMFTASLGLATARFCKQMWPDKTICKVKIWFAVHRAAMVAVFVIGITAFIIIFVYVDGYSSITGDNFKKAHPVLGIIVTALLFVNPFMSLLRCAPNHPRRPIFNWAHWLVGSSAHILGGVTIAFGLYLEKANLNSRKGLIIMIIYGSWHVVFFLIMSLIDYLLNSRSSKNSYNVSAADTKDVNSTLKYGLLNESYGFPFSGIKQLLVLVHVVFVLALTIALLVLIIDGDI